MNRLPSGRPAEDADLDASIVDELAEEGAKLAPPEAFGFPVRAGASDYFATIGDGQVALAPGVIVPADADVETLERRARAAGWPPGHGAALYDVLHGPLEITSIETGFADTALPDSRLPARLPHNGLIGFAGHSEEWLEADRARRTQRHFPA